MVLISENSVLLPKKVIPTRVTQNDIILIDSHACMGNRSVTRKSNKKVEMWGWGFNSLKEFVPEKKQKKKTDTFPV